MKPESIQLGRLLKKCPDETQEQLAGCLERWTAADPAALTSSERRDALVISGLAMALVLSEHGRYLAEQEPLRRAALLAGAWRRIKADLGFESNAEEDKLIVGKALEALPVAARGRIITQ